MSEATIEIFEAICPKKGTAHLRTWNLPRSQVKAESWQLVCEDGCLHFFGTDICKTAQHGAMHDQKRMLRKMRGEHSDTEEEDEESAGENEKD